MIITGTQPVVISSGQSLSASVKLDPGQTIVGIALPSGWTTANLTFQTCLDISVASPVWRNVYTPAGVEYAVGADVDRHVVIPPTDLMGITHLKVRSGTAAAGVNQIADRTIVLLLREV